MATKCWCTWISTARVSRRPKARRRSCRTAASPNTWKVRAVAAHLRIPLELEFVDLTKGASHTPEYLALNPTGRTPTLVDGDFKVWESVAIMQYLASKAPNTLWPDDPWSRADIAPWQCWHLAHWGKEACEPLIIERLVKKLLNLGPPDEAVVAKALACFNKEAAVLDAHLAKQPYLVGKDLTLADFSVAASTTRSHSPKSSKLSAGAIFFSAA